MISAAAVAAAAGQIFSVELIGLRDISSFQVEGLVRGPNRV